jgi:hypothetical protein
LALLQKRGQRPGIRALQSKPVEMARSANETPAASSHSPPLCRRMLSNDPQFAASCATSSGSMSISPSTSSALVRQKEPDLGPRRDPARPSHEEGHKRHAPPRSPQLAGGQGSTADAWTRPALGVHLLSLTVEVIFNDHAAHKYLKVIACPTDIPRHLPTRTRAAWHPKAESVVSNEAASGASPDRAPRRPTETNSGLAAFSQRVALGCELLNTNSLASGVAVRHERRDRTQSVTVWPRTHGI